MTLVLHIIFPVKFNARAGAPDIVLSW